MTSRSRARRGRRPTARHWLGLRYLTNTTTRSRAGVAQRLERLGLTLGADMLFTPLAAAQRLLMDSGAHRIRLAAPPSVAEDFVGLELATSGPVDAVVIGSLYKAFGWDLLNELFVLVRGGAQLVALYKDQYYLREDGISLDVGPFVVALEYTANVEAVVVGKPSAASFQWALDNLGVTAAEPLMVGDDIAADIGGAQGAGLQAVQVRCGKYTAADLDHPTVRPDFRINSIAALPDLIGDLA